MISTAERDLMKRITIVLAFIFLFTAGFSTLDRIYSQKFLATTGGARWIWAQHRMSANEPVAFFAARDFTLPAKRYFTHLKIAGDPEYELYVNGREIAGRRAGEERQLDLYDISELVGTGRNRIVVAVRAPQGVGGLLASIDIAAETENWVVTDGSWRIYRRWRPDLLLRDVPDLPSEPPVIVGMPPIGRWNYLTLVRRPLAAPALKVAPPRSSFQLIAYLPAIRTRSGVAVAVAERARATAFDFGFTRGRVRLIRDRDRGGSRLVNVRFANARDELGLIEWNIRPVVFAPGELSVTTPEPHSFRYVMVFGRGVTAEVLR
jgi:hypothetical protein